VTDWLWVAAGLLVILWLARDLGEEYEYVEATA
jgi:hypothetical protein